MTDLDLSLSPTRHAPAILGCAAVLLTAGSGLGTAMALSQQGGDTRTLDRLAPSQGAAVPLPVAARTAPAPVLVHEEAHVASGALNGSLYESARAVGATPTLVAQAVRLFAKKLDFARELKAGDPFRLVFDRTATPDGRTVKAGALLYAEIGAGERTARFYRFAHDGRTDYLDGVGREPKPLLLRTPVDGARVTSGFGMRLHPILGFNRLHPGVDFGAPEGSPVLAAGDGVVEEVKWAGGYGHWLKIGHADGFETGYGHLLRYAPGVKPGAAVTQGQVVAYVGSTGLSTGPHLHFEMMHDGEKLDPASAKVPLSDGLDTATRLAFDAQKARIDRVLSAGATQRTAQLARPAGASAARTG